jgi:hypothetical protein
MTKRSLFAQEQHQPSGISNGECTIPFYPSEKTELFDIDDLVDLKERAYIFQKKAGRSYRPV